VSDVNSGKWFELPPGLGSDYSGDRRASLRPAHRRRDRRGNGGRRSLVERDHRCGAAKPRTCLAFTCSTVIDRYESRARHPYTAEAREPCAFCRRPRGVLPNRGRCRVLFCVVFLRGGLRCLAKTVRAGGSRARRNALEAARQEWQALAARWQSEAATSTFTQELQLLEKARDELTDCRKSAKDASRCYFPSEKSGNASGISTGFTLTVPRFRTSAQVGKRCSRLTGSRLPPTLSAAGS